MNTDPNMSEQSGQTTTTERTEKNKYKILILSDRDTDLTKINPRMWWEQIWEHIDLTYHKNLVDLMDQSTEALDAHTAYHIKEDVTWALSPEAKQEIMRGHWERELKDGNLSKLLKLFKKLLCPPEMYSTA